MQLDPPLHVIPANPERTATDVATAAFDDCPDHSGHPDRFAGVAVVTRPIERVFPDSGTDENRDGVPRNFRLD